MEYEKNISYASKENSDEILSLWNICFPEFPEFTKWYFENIFSFKNTLIYKEDNKIISMTQEIPLIFNSLKKATYIYGACTHPLYRKKGIMAKLLRQSFENDIKKGTGLSILIPENEELFNFYEKFGYTKATLIKKEFFKSTLLNKEFRKKYIFRKAVYADIENMNELYNKTLSQSDFIFRDNTFWKNQMRMFNDLGGGCFCLYNEKNSQLEAYAFLWNEESLTAQEICFKDDFAKNIICENILSEFNTDKSFILNIYDSQGEYKSCVKFHNTKDNYVSDYTINLLWN